MSFLSIEALDVRHGLLRAVRGVSFQVARGDVMALVGANGAGKTTLLRAIAGSHPPVAGRVLLDGRDITALPDYKRVGEGIALVPEGRRLFADMSVEENLLLAAGLRRPGPWTLDKVFQTFPNLIPRRKLKAGQLSGGEQQATAIGRALMTNPEVLLLDEVSLGLSPLAVGRVYESIATLIAAGTTIVLVEQDIKRVLEVSHQVVCMLEGQIVANAPTREISRERIMEAYFGLRRGKAREALQ